MAKTSEINGHYHTHGNIEHSHPGAKTYKKLGCGIPMVKGGTLTLLAGGYQVGIGVTNLESPSPFTKILKKIEYLVYQANVANFVDRLRVYGLSIATGQDLLYTDNTDRDSQQFVELDVDIDLSIYESVSIILDTVLGTDNALDLGWVRVVGF